MAGKSIVFITEVYDGAFPAAFSRYQLRPTG